MRWATLAITEEHCTDWLSEHVREKHCEAIAAVEVAETGNVVDISEPHDVMYDEIWIESQILQGSVVGYKIRFLYRKSGIAWPWSVPLRESGPQERRSWHRTASGGKGGGDR